MIATAATLTSLEPGELLVRIVRDGWTIAPDHLAIAQANRALHNGGQRVGDYRGAEPNAAQLECLRGSP